MRLVGKDVPVTLEPHELALSAFVGIGRRIMSVNQGFAGKFPADPSWGWLADLYGAWGEAAFAKAANVYWNARVTNAKRLPGPDFIGRIQTRTTEHNHGRLTVYDYESKDDFFVLVTGTAPAFVVRGWILGGDAMRPEHWNEELKRPAYFVRQEFLQAFPIRWNSE